MVDAMDTALAQALRLKASHALAVGLHRRDGAAIVLIVDDSRNVHNPYAREVSIHIGAILARTGDGIYVDLDGLCGQVDVDARYLRRNDGADLRVIILDSEHALSPFVSTDWDFQLSPLSEAEIADSLRQHDERIGRSFVALL